MNVYTSKQPLLLYLISSRNHQLQAQWLHKAMIKKLEHIDIYVINFSVCMKKMMQLYACNCCNTGKSALTDMKHDAQECAVPKGECFQYIIQCGTLRMPKI